MSTHTLPTQHPFGHEVASQTHRPVGLHSWPAAHALHAAPVAPHDVLDSLASSSHVPLAAQHPGHDDPPQVHAPLEQASPVPQAEHTRPPVPHSVDDCAAMGTHWPAASQQPFGHDVASQTQLPVTSQV